MEDKNENPLKPEVYKEMRSVKKSKPSVERVPILRGCKNSACFCTGRCHDVIGYREKLPGEQ